MHDLIRDRAVDPNELVAELAAVEPIAVGDQRAVDFLSEFASRLLKPRFTRVYPELASLGFFLRKAELLRLVADITRVDVDVRRAPRGIVFHVPPANVDTVFVYSWALSLLCGNQNVVRVSDRSAGAARQIIALLTELLDATEPALQQSQRFVSMAHDDPGFELISRGCHLRVIWGGDAAIESVRRHPLSPRATDVTFPDRSSLAVLDAITVGAMAQRELNELAAGFANDVWWFDQAACSSPSSIVWLGDAGDAAIARERFFDAVESHLRARQMGQDPSMSVQRRVALYGAAMATGGARLDVGRSSITTIAPPSRVSPRWFGAGGFAEYRVTTITELASTLISKDQTLTHFGVRRSDLLSLVDALGGRAVDRMVPVGQALQFQRFWDGYDLLATMTKTVTVLGGRPDVS
jgi:hypothetical protein